MYFGYVNGFVLYKYSHYKTGTVNPNKEQPILRGLLSYGWQLNGIYVNWSIANTKSGWLQVSFILQIVSTDTWYFLHIYTFRCDGGALGPSISTCQPWTLHQHLSALNITLVFHIYLPRWWWGSRSKCQHLSEPIPGIFSHIYLQVWWWGSTSKCLQSVSTDKWHFSHIYTIRCNGGVLGPSVSTYQHWLFPHIYIHSGVIVRL